MAEQSIDTEIVYEMGHMGGLAAELVLMLARASDLPDPGSVTIYGILNGQVHDHVSLQFPQVALSRDAIVMWATLFGGVIESSTEQTDNGPQLWVSAKFPWMHLDVKAFAHIPLTALEAIPTTHQDYPHEPGRLYGCPACEARCHCTPDTAPCIFDGPHTLPPF